MTAPESKTSKRISQGREREEQALQLRIAGFTYKRMGETMGISESGAYKAVVRALRRLNERIAENAEELRRLEMERLTALHRVFWSRAQRGDERAADRVLRISAAIRALYGLDAPTRTDVRASVVTSYDDALNKVYSEE
jgi:DNA-binding CsgD family transcriptional regulator